MNNKELWKPINDFPNYFVSNLGRIKRFYPSKNKEKILKFGYNNDGYNQVCLYKNGKKNTHRVCRLVAKAFLPNNDGNLVVNHIDKNRKNDNVSNLEWVSIKYNVRYSRAKKILGINVKDNEKLVFDSLKDAEKEGFNLGNVWACCNNRRNQYKGYKWRYANEI